MIVASLSSAENRTCKVDQYLTWQWTYHPVGKVQILEELAPFERFKIAEALEVDLYLFAYFNISKCARMHMMIVCMRVIGPCFLCIHVFCSDFPLRARATTPRRERDTNSLYTVSGAKL